MSSMDYLWEVPAFGAGLFAVEVNMFGYVHAMTEFNKHKSQADTPKKLQDLIQELTTNVSTHKQFNTLIKPGVYLAKQRMKYHYNKQYGETK